ncbi:MAG TPA: GMC family oxidoreductase [Casimicrobiaceae bacterium]|nr:GMC family oxidoreductase [Casimicrobiaceae bacterium]
MTTRASDPYRSASAARWNIIDASRASDDITLECDVAIIGSGAGGGVAAETLARSGLRVVIVEEGPLATSSDFRMLESDAYPELYQESAARKTADKAINILQGRCVGGGTTVNWTSSFRTPDATLAHWRSVYGIAGFAPADLVPWFEMMETRLAIAPWTIAPNANNAALARGAAKIGIASAMIRRNVKACANIGYCGVGCPLDAKQSMLITTIPAALERGATLVTRARAERLMVVNDRVDSLLCHGMDASGTTPTARRINVRARAYCSAGGAIGTPGLFLRSGLPDPHGLVGRRTFLHPTIVSAAVMPELVNGFAGAPQTVYSDHYLDTLSPTGPIGFKLEAPPVHPILAAITLPGHGETHASFMRQFAHLHVLIALLRDGFHAESAGGSVRLRDDGTPLLDYPLKPYVWDGVRRAFRAMAELQFAAGAAKVMPIHAGGAAFDSVDSARRAIDGFALAPLVTPVVSAHVMGGCPLGPDARRAVVDTSGRHHRLSNLYVIDGSLFPTSIGANPQLSIYAVAAKLAASLVAALGGRAPATT